MKLVKCDRCCTTSEESLALDWRTLQVVHPVQTWASSHLADLCPRCIKHLENEITSPTTPKEKS